MRAHISQPIHLVGPDRFWSKKSHHHHQVFSCSFIVSRVGFKCPPQAQLQSQQPCTPILCLTAPGKGQGCGQESPRTRAHAAGSPAGWALLHPLMTPQICLNIHTNTTQFHGQIISSAACALQLMLPLRSLPACVQDTAGVVHCSYPATAQCNDNTFIYQSEMRLQEVAPKAPFILGPA